jgi:uncharacterized RDD family membrane protein YckC
MRGMIRAIPSRSFRWSVRQPLLMSEPPPLIIKSHSLVGSRFGVRCLARTIDIVFGLFLGMIAGIAATVVLIVLQRKGDLDPDWQSRVKGLSFTGVMFGIIGSIAYHTICDGVHGATLGKIICGIRVVKEDGRPSGMGGAFVRSTAYLWDGMLFGFVAYHSMEKSTLRQRYGDVWGETAVIGVSHLSSEAKRSTLRFLIGLSLGCFAAITFTALGLIVLARG